MKPGIASLGVVVVAGALLTPVTWAGEITGRLSLKNQKQGDPTAAQIEIVCTAAPEKSEKTGKSTKAEKSTEPEQPAKPSTYKTSATLPGPYSVPVKEEGECTLTVNYQGKTASIPIVSKEGIARYDLVLALVDGKLSLVRE